MVLFTENTLLPQGTSLKGQRADYKIEHSLSAGRAGQTYKAIVEKLKPDKPDQEAPLTPGSEVVVKFPKPATIRLLIHHDAAILQETIALKQLRGVRSVAQFLDTGLHGPEEVRFIVEQFINGSNLDTFMEATYPNEEGQFTGVPKADHFFNWARQLTEAVIAIHQRQITHCDLKPANVRVNEERRILLIDLGRAGFRAHQVASSETLPDAPPHIAPRGSETVEGDIYALGALLFYLATGDKEPVTDKDIDKLKKKVEERILQANSELYGTMNNELDLIVPVYLNQRVVFDLVAMLQGGIATVTKVVETEAESSSAAAEVGGTFGLNKALSSLLRVNLSGSLSGETGGESGASRSEERVHTPASLFYPGFPIWLL